MPQGTQEQASTEVTVPADPVEFDRSVLESVVHDKMSAVFSDGDETLAEEADPKPATESTEQATVEPAAKEAPEEETEEKAPEAAAASQKTEKSATTPATPATDPAIPAAYRRSLKAYQWTDQEIDAAAKADPSAFAKTAEKLHLTRVAETKRWAELGRATIAAQPAATVQETPKIDIAALKKQYGPNEPLILALEAQQSALDRTNTFITDTHKRQAASEEAALANTVDGLFNSDASYHDFYGKKGGTLTEPQLAARGKVLTMTEQLIRGAAAQGAPITLEEAWTAAHDATASPVAAKVAVQKIATQVRERQQAITLKPGARAKAAPKAGDRTTLEANVGKGLKKAFGK